MTDIHRHAAGMQAALPDILAMAERCVNIDSGSYLAGGVNAVIDIWARMAAGMGFAVERAPLPGFGDQMTARLPLGGNGPRVLVLGHADTVWPAGIAAEWPFKREGDRITGPGVGDMKINVVMALHAIRMLLAEKALTVSSISPAKNCSTGESVSTCINSLTASTKLARPPTPQAMPAIIGRALARPSSAARVPMATVFGPGEAMMSR